MKSFKFIIPLLFVFCGFYAQAEEVRLYEWIPGNSMANLILPVRSSETPQAAAERYLHELSKNPELMELFEGRLPHLPTDNIRPLQDNHREARALLMANLPKDYTQNSERVQSFIKIFSQARHESFILPINANLGLSHTETRDMLDQISTKFPLLVAMGGDDVEPRLYGKENFHARNTIPARDQFEIQLIKHYVATEKGFLLGICRGSQISAVALGYQLIQDLPFHKGEQVKHGNDWHPVDVYTTKNNILSQLTRTGSLQVNSLHHQSVIYKEGGPLEIAARSSDGTVEATELKNGRGLLLQFHPELMYNELGRNILWKALEQKNKVMPLRCSKVF